MVQTYSDGDNVYSVDMMFAYIKLFKPTSKWMEVKSLKKTLEYPGWGEPNKGIHFSPLDVLANPKKYKRNTERIENADLNYPIIVAGKYVVDGVHRLTKAVMQGKKKIKAYYFNKTIMRKFLIDKKRDWNRVNKMGTYEFIELFYKRFCR